MESHPDRGGTSEKFHAVSTAYKILGDPERRKLYDETGSTDDKSLDIQFIEFVCFQIGHVLEMDETYISLTDVIKDIKDKTKIYIVSRKNILSDLEKKIKKASKLKSKIKFKGDVKKTYFHRL